ncbi:hypothetical protein GIB67_013187 [Kingdonia uniflora]|uniref:Protein arginine N-methyltransferase domain-containing protein n=1 Tax=Kingdonia uniflora TaxID=39325 RepID=A0A7J7LCV7_9MAGN|nr:hypothetical protein GIB67_013187 [Kingdonia uniflora]
MMAARAMNSSDANKCPGAMGIVSACESYLPMIKLSRKVLRTNCMDKKIHILYKRSDELKVGADLASHADILVSEILDSELLGEGLIPSLQHAHDNLLVKSPQTVPYRATTYGQLVESNFLWKLHDLFNNESEAMDGVHLVPTGLETIMHAKPQQYSMHCDAIAKEIRLLSEPFKIFEFDFWKRPESRGETGLHIKATMAGKVHAVVSWWVLQLDSEGTVFYSTSPRWISTPANHDKLQTQFPGSEDWCDHWKQCVWFVPGGMSISKDEQIHFQAVHNETSVSYNLKYDNRRTEHYTTPVEMCELVLSPERIAVYGDRKWRYAMLTALQNILQGKVNPLCVVVDDSVFLTILAAHLSSTSHIISVFPGIKEIGARYMHAVAGANNFSMDRLEVLGRRTQCLTMDDTNQRKVDIILGEPFYYGNEGMLPWQNLRFWKERTMLHSVLSDDVLIMPCKGILKACAMSLPDLWRSRCCINNIEGFDHSVVNETFGACGDIPASSEGPCLPYFIWQCGEIEELTEVFKLMEFDFLKPMSPCFGKTKVEFNQTGICHGFALWIDWVMHAESSTILSTGPDHRCYKQGVKLLSKPVAVGINGLRSILECHSIEIEASFNPSNGELVVKHSFS